jgi:endonuclease/exonuclease/phosphatase family metal-dependent hydrolase
MVRVFLFARIYFECPISDIGNMLMVRHLVFLSLVLLSFAPAWAQDSIKVLTWNIQMLPRFVNSNGKIKRARAIVDKLKQGSYDVIAFQELFHARSRRIITRGLSGSYPYHTRILNKKTFSLKSNGGVMLFSKHPIKTSYQIRYKARMGFDRFSRKGAVLAEIDVKGKRVQVAGTHLQAFGDQSILYSQYHQLAEELLKPNSRPGIPQLLCGDFNTLKTVPTRLPADISPDFIDRLPRYHYMLSTLEANDGELTGEQQFTMDRPYNDLCRTRKEFRLLLDYILLRPNGIADLSIRRKVEIMRHQWDQYHRDLSDHFGLEAVLSGF